MAISANTTLVTNFNVDPYYDDYDADKGFLRVLYRPGQAVQARELTQMQTALQEQIKRHGDHVFKNGSMVIPGSVNIDNQIFFIKIEDIEDSVDVTTYLAEFRNKIITGESSGVKAQVIDTSECNCVVDDTIPTLYFKIVEPGTGDVKRFTVGEQITARNADNTITTNPDLTTSQTTARTVTIRSLGDGGEAPTTFTGNETTDVQGKALNVDVQAGVYYIDGYFVATPEIHLYVGRFTNKPSARVGFKVTDSFVTSDNDTTLLDPAQGSYNYAAPGADRYKINVELVQLAYDNDGSSLSYKFIELIRVLNGRIQHQVDKSSYAELEKTFARRTYDESGDYEVNKFKISTREHYNNGTNDGLYSPTPASPISGVTYGNADKFVISLDPGKAYVRGYEIESVATQYVSANKARVVDGNENGHVARVDDQVIGTSVGNYILVDGVAFNPDISTFETVDLSITRNTTPGTRAASADRIGTARVKAFQLHSGDYTAANTTQYKIGLFNIQMNSGYSFENDVKSITGRTGTDDFTCNIVPRLDQLQGSASSFGNTTITGVGTNFTSVLAANDIVYIDGNRVGQILSVDDNLTLTLKASSATTVTGGAISVSRAELKEANKTSLLFPVGYDNIKTLRGYDSGTETDSLKSGDHTVRRVLTDTATGTQIEFELTNINETWLSDTNLNNFTLIDNSTGTPVPITTSTVSFDDDADRKIVTITSLPTSGGSYTLIASVRQVNTRAAEKTKSLQTGYNYSITGKRNVTRTTINLDKADVLRVTDIRMTPGDFDTYDNTNYISILERYDLDDGQRDAFYTTGKIVLKAGQPVPTGAIRVTYDYFTHTGTGNYFSVDSYSTIDYDLIPEYNITGTDGRPTTVSLADVLDYRPVLDGTNTFFNEIPRIGNDFTSPIAYYLPRIDKISLDSVGNIVVSTGTPALLPQEPEDPKEAMVLATMYVPPYTYSATDIKIYQRDNRRYTMRDIGKIDRRVTNLEYYTVLNLLEKETEQLQIQDDVTGLDRFKNGFIVDQFTGHGIGDVKDPDYRIAVDSQKREARPMHYTTGLDINENLISGGARASVNYAKTGDFVTLPYSNTLFIYNPHTSRTIDVNPYKIGAFKGEITLNPEGDNWKETDRRPDLVVTDDNNFDMIKYLADEIGVTGTVWNEWETNWTGIQTSTRTWQTGDPSRRRQTVRGFEETITEMEGTRSREGIETSLQTAVNAVDYGDRVIDIGFTPYMRARPVVYTAKNLKALTKFYGFFDGVDVNDYVKPADVFKVTRNNTKMEFNPATLANNIFTDSYFRSVNGVAQPAYNIGDVITNGNSSPVTINNIVNITSVSGNTEFYITVPDSSDVKPGHHVYLYNLAPTNPVTVDSPLLGGVTIPKSTITVGTSANTSSQLNQRTFKVTSVTDTGSEKHVTLQNIDGSTIDAFDSYDVTASQPDGYSAGDGGKMLRLRASGVIAYAGYEHSSDANGVSVQDIHVVNIKNGFAIGETADGETTIPGTSLKNDVTLTAINGSSTSTSAPTMKALGDEIRADTDGATVGVFELPQTDALRFRTGERTFKLIDSQSNSDADFDSKGSAVYYSQGVTLQKERTIVNSREARFVQDRLFESLPVRRTTTSTRQLYSYYTGHDPIAQTFTVQSQGGAFVTGCDLFFSEAGARPVTVELRTTNNGVPSTKILPLSVVTLQPSQINTSENGTVATRFGFQAPVYLQDGETYALIAKTDQPGCQIHISELGKNDLATGAVISSQPLTGSLFLSQNSKEFEINPLLDMKFRLYKAEFDISSEVTAEFRANPPLPKTLGKDPFEFTPNTNKVRVYYRNHGFTANSKVSFSGLTPNQYFGANSASLGVPGRLLNGVHEVSSAGLDDDTFIVELPVTDADGRNLLSGNTSNFIKGRYGGNSVIVTSEALADYMYLKTSDLVFANTSLAYHVKAEAASSTPTSGTFTDWLPIVPNSNYTFENRKVIRNSENQTVVGGNKVPSLRMRATFSSENSNISPLIDIAKLNSIVTRNLVNDKTQSDVNDADIDTRNLLVYGDVANGAYTLAGTGTITVSTVSGNVAGISTTFTTQVNVDDQLALQSNGAIIGTVASVPNTTHIVLDSTSNVTATGAAYNIVGQPKLTFASAANTSTLGAISTVIDTADNLLDNAVIGKYITIDGVTSGINGTYVVKDIVTETESATFAGNDETDKTTVFVSPAFTASNTTIDMLSDNDWSIKILDHYVEDFAPVGTYNKANYITRTLSLTNPAENIRIIFDGSTPQYTDIDIYYRTWSGDTDLDVLPYINTGYNNITINPVDTFTERTVEVTDIPPYLNADIKVIFRSSNSTNVPKIKNFRVIAYS